MRIKLTKQLIPDINAPRVKNCFLCNEEMKKPFPSYIVARETIFCTSCLRKEEGRFYCDRCASPRDMENMRLTHDGDLGCLWCITFCPCGTGFIAETDDDIISCDLCGEVVCEEVCLGECITNDYGELVCGECQQQESN